MVVRFRRNELVVSGNDEGCLIESALMLTRNRIHAAENASTEAFFVARVRSTALLALLVISIAAFAAVGTTSTMITDDYCHASSALQLGVVGSTVSSYQSWSGRWAHLITAGALYNVFVTATPAITAAALIIAAALAAYAAFGAGGLLLICAWLLMLQRIIWSGVYWIPAGVTYVAPLVMVLVLLALARRKTNPLLLVLLAAFGAGFNESIGLVMAFAALLYGRKSILIGALFGFAIVALAPGNGLRMEFEGGMDFSQALLMPFVALAEHGIPLLLFIPIAPLAAVIAGMHMPQAFDRRVFLIAAFAFAFGVASGAYVLGYITPRTLVMPIAAAAVALFHFGQVVGTRYRLTAQLQVVVVMLVTLASLSLAFDALRPNAPSLAARLGVPEVLPTWAVECQQMFSLVTR